MVCQVSSAVYPGAKYIITKYDANIKVNENNVYNITESYDVCYTQSGSHGIYRDIPTSADFRRANGDVTKNVKTQVTNIKVTGDKVSKSRENNNIRLKIGDPDRTLSKGETKHYTISYDYNFGPDRLNGVDEFYFNIIGSEWASDVLFLDTDFRIEFPKDIEESKIGFTHGYKHDSLDGGTPFELKNNRTIVGSYSDPLKGGEALTIRVTLPEGYIQNAAYGTNTIGLIIFTVLTVIILAIILLCFLAFGRDEKLPLYNRTSPPDGMNPVQFGALVNSSDSECVTSLFYYLAEKGYLKIEETKKNKFDIIILKDYDGADPSERVFMESLKRYDSDNDGRIKLSSLKDRFYSKISKIIKAAGVKELKSKIYTKSGNTYQALAYTTLVIYLVLTVIFLIADPYANDDTMIVLMLLAFFIIPGIWIATLGLKQLFKEGNRISGVIMIIFGGMFAYIPLMLLLNIDLLFDSTQITMILEAAAATAIIGLCAKNGKRYTEEGRKIMTDVLSYYENIKNARPDADHGFSYFYYTFAFAFAAGLSSAFARRFKDAIAQPPDWYTGTSSFSHFDTSSFSSAMHSISSSSTSSPSSSSGGGGGGGGGGSSGGGGGGGGGGGW